MKKNTTEHYPAWYDLIVIVVLFFLAGVAGALLATGAVGTEPKNANLLTFAAYTFQSVIAIAAILYYTKRRKGKGTRLLNFSIKPGDPAITLWGFILVLAVSIVIEPVIELFPAKYMEMINQAIGTGGWAMLTSIVVAPIAEEIIFRGIIQGDAMKKWGPVNAILISSLVFGIIHGIPPQMVNAFFVGLVLGYIFLKTSSLVPVIVIHALNNAFAYISMVFTGDEVVTTRQMINNDTWYRVTYAACIVIVAIACVNTYTHIKALKKKWQEENAVDNN